jgi:YebC/PmpR family DNA-binding regulatory protein
MSGHNKWSKIKRKKEVGDAQKSRVFGKLARSITLESKKALGNLSAPGLRVAIEKARKVNMPSDNIDRAVEKGKSGSEGSLERVLYEAYGPGGVALIIDGLTDSRNRTSAELRHLLTQNGGQLAEPGAASWAFSVTAEGYEPRTTVPISEEDGERLSLLVEKLEDHDDIQDVYVNAVSQ